MSALTLVAVVTSLAGVPASQGDRVDCNPWQTCRDLAIAAAERGDSETFHTIAWRAVQTGPRNDPELMYLLARAQSVSGRPNDALVMLRRLSDRGFVRLEVETLEDFRRVRNLPEWPAMLDTLRQAAGSSGGQPASPALPVAVSKATPVPIAKPPANSTDGAAAPVPPENARANAEEGLAVPAAVGTAAAMAYDAVSGRMVIADASSDTLKVLSELSANAVDLVSRGWAGKYRTAAIAIDGRRGDLWVVGSDASAGQSESALHRVQLISGRLRYTVALPAEAGAARFGAVALSANNAFVLDVEGRRIFELAQGGKTLQLRMKVPVNAPASLAMAGDDVAFVSHAGGIARLDLARRRSAGLSAAKGIDLRGLQWMEHYEGSLLGIQRRSDGTLAAVRIRLDSGGARATALEVVGPSASPAATVMNGVFYFLESREGTRVVRAVSLR
jgi:hypothetical protein